MAPLSFSREQSDLLAALRERDAKHDSKLGEMLLGVFYALSQTDNPDRFSQAAQSMRELLDRLPLQYEGAPVHVPVAKAADHMNALVDQVDKAKKNSKCFHKNVANWDGTIDPPLARLLIQLDVIVEERKTWVSKNERNRKFIRQLDPTGEPLPQMREDDALTEWRGFDKYFQAVAHHNVFPTAEDFDTHMMSCIRMLLAQLKPAPFETFNLLDEIIGEAEGK